MKALKSIAFACLLALTTSASFAGPEVVKKEADKALKLQIEKTIRFPESMLNKINESTATVLITISERGEIGVVSVDCENTELKNEIIKQLDHSTINTLSTSAEQLVRLTINFKQL